MSRVRVREAVEGDLPATARIIAAEGQGSEPEWRERFAVVLADSSRLFLVAEVDRQVVGFGQARQVQRPELSSTRPPSGVWFLSGVTVDRAHRRAGIALALTEARLERLGDVPVHYAAEPDDVATITLHERLGFRRAGHIALSGDDRPLLLFRRDPPR